MQTAVCDSLDLLDKAVAEPDPIKRMAILTAYTMVQLNHFERAQQKPFNPMLGETFEMVTDKYQMICELVEHHPIIISYYVEGKSGYRRHTTLKPKPKFAKGSIQATN